jgi:hypothetical protein
MKTFISFIFILIFAGFIPLSCCKNEGGSTFKMDFTQFNSVHYLAGLNLYDSLSSQIDFDTIRNADSLYLLANMDIKNVAALQPYFSLTATAFACTSPSSIYVMKYAIDSIVINSNQVYNGMPAGTNLYYTIVENAQGYIDILNNSVSFNNANLLFKIVHAPTDNYTHQLTLKVYKHNSTVVERTLKTFTWI